VLPANRVYLLKRPFMAIHFENGGKGQIVLLQKGAELRIVGFSCLCECFEVMWEGGIYSVFQVDLLESWPSPTEPVRTSAVAAACA
jgi:hypothetical protein